jgi:hypothetical protein
MFVSEHPSMVSSIEFGWFWYFRSCWWYRAVSSEISVQAAGLAQISRLRYVGRSWWGRIFSMLCTSQAVTGVKDDQLKKCGFPMFSHACPIFIQVTLPFFSCCFLVLRCPSNPLDGSHRAHNGNEPLQCQVENARAEGFCELGILSPRL